MVPFEYALPNWIKQAQEKGATHLVIMTSNSYGVKHPFSAFGEQDLKNFEQMDGFALSEIIPIQPNPSEVN